MWNFKKKKGLEWPTDDNGEAIPPAYLTHISGGPLDTELTLNLLEAYGIPHLTDLPNNGAFGKLIFGHPPSGIEVFVPETLLEEAQGLLNAEIVGDDDDPDNMTGENEDYEEEQEEE